MSYILDALKRAEAQRERGQVPGLHAQPVPIAPAPVATSRLGWWVGLACGLVALVAGGLYWHSDSTQAAPAVVLAAPVAAAPPPPAPAPAPVAVPVPPPAPAPLPSVKSVPQTPPAARPPVTKPAATPAAPVNKPVPLQRRQAASAAAPAAVPAAIPALADLPEDLRRTVPKLVVSGSVYSSNPAQRMLIVNGQVLNEGSTLAPDLVLERIGAKSAVLSLRGTQFRLDY